MSTVPELPNRLPRPHDELRRLEAAWQAPRGWRLLKSVNNTHVGLFYVATAMGFLLLAGVLGLLIRAQLALPAGTLMTENTYNQVFTMHGTVMMFLFAVPVVEAVAVYLLPGMLGARDLPFPRLSAYAFWAYAVGGIGFFCTLFVGLAPDGGWFMYPPLTGATYSPGLGADFWLLGIGFIEISAIAGAIELIIGILFTRAPGMTLARLPVFAWAMLVVGFMVVFAFPAIIAGTALLEMERAFDWPFFIAERGGDPLLWQHLFWFFGHPEVYIIFLPAAGLVSMMVPVIARTPLVGYRAVVLALVAVGTMSFALWLHHMFTAGLGSLTMLLVSAVSMAIAIPSGVQLFAWFATLRSGRVSFSTPALFVLGFFCLFAIGGLTGVMVAALPFNLQVHDSYFIVAHLHYVLIGGLVFPLFGALYHWLPLLKGRPLGERTGRWVFGLMFGGFNLAFFPMHMAGLQGMPRRIASYAPDMGWTLWNLLSTAGAAVFALGVLLFVIDAARVLSRPAQPHGDPWRAATLEWLPAQNYGARSIPTVHGRDPLWQQPGLAAQVVAGQHWLPGTTSGRRETLVTTPIAARLSHLIVLPGDSWLPLVAAVGTAGFFLLLTAKATLPAWACGVVAVLAVLCWLWQLDRPPHAARVPIGDGVQVPVGARGHRSHAWWGMVVLLAVWASIFASMVFAHLHVAMQATVCPPPGAQLPATRWSLTAALGWVATAALMGWSAHAVAELPQRRGTMVLRLLLAVATAVAAFACQWAGHLLAGLAPRADAWSATAAALLALQGVGTLVLLMMGCYLVARTACGHLQPQARSSIDCCALAWYAAAAQGVLFEFVVQGLPPLLDA